MLVNNRTPDLPPEEQNQGTYVHKPISVHIYEAGGDMSGFSEVEQREVEAWIKVHGPRKPALADVSVERSTGLAPEFAAPYGKKVARKPGKSPDPTPYDVMEHIVSTALSTYNDGQKEALFNHLAAELGYIVE